MSFKAKKRFIAGAVCPKCSEMDSLKMHQQDGFQYRECVSCGFEDKLALDGSTVDDNNLITRVSPQGKTLLDQDEQPLKIIDPSKLH